jgi:AcrR family transcriptional regulator
MNSGWHIGCYISTVVKNSAEPSLRGRRPGRPETREAIRSAARRRFLAEGYRAVTLRTIAADAKVDPALISYFFGSKQDLFAAAMALPANPADVIAAALQGDPAGIPERLLRAFLATWDDPEKGAPLRALLGSVGQDPGPTRLLREVIHERMINAIASRLTGPQRAQRAAAVAVQMMGLAFGRYILQVEPLASMSHDALVRRMVPALRAALQP